MSKTEAQRFSSAYLGFCIFYAVVLLLWGHLDGDPWLQQLAWLVFVPHVFFSLFAYTGTHHK